MRKTLLSLALLAAAANGHADIVLKTSEIINVCPKELTTSDKTIAYTIDDDKVTIYTPDFLVNKTFTLPQNRHISGSYTEKGLVKVTGAKFKFDDYNKSDYYGTTFEKMEDITATTQEELLEYLGSGYASFIDPMGNPGCYLTTYKLDGYSSGYPNCYLGELFGAKYPKSWFVIIDGSVYYYSYSYSNSYPYDLIYDDSTTEWTRSIQYEYSHLYTGSPDFYVDGKLLSDDITLTQNLFNDDDKWEVIMTEYGPVEYHYSDEQVGSVQEDGTVELSRNASYVNNAIGTAIYNEDGEKLCTFEVEDIYAIHIMNGKKYVLGFVENKGDDVILYEINTNGDDIDAIKKVEVKGESRLDAERGIVMVDINAEQAGGEVVVSTADGKVMASKQVNAGQSRINESPLPNGIYVVSLMKDGKVIESEKYLVR